MTGENADGEKQGETKVDQLAFFLMPTDIFKGLHVGITKVAGPHAAKVLLYSCGYEAGVSVTSKMQMDDVNSENLEKRIKTLWLQVGLGNVKILSMDNGVIEMECVDSNEAAAVGKAQLPSCDITSGYLAGMMTVLLGQKFNGKENKCVCTGSEACIFKISKDELFST